LVSNRSCAGGRAALWSMSAYHDLLLLEFAVDNPNDYHEHPNFSAFMVRKTFPQTFGRFDENFVPAYREDSDARARLALAKRKAYVTGGAWVYHFGSRTISADPDLREEISFRFQARDAYFREKWGQGVLSDVQQLRARYYPHPYNE